MTLSVPSCFAAATSASIPPAVAALVAVAQLLPEDGALPPPLPAPPPPPELTHPVAVVRVSAAPSTAATRRVRVMRRNVAPGPHSPRARADHRGAKTPA